MYATYIIVIDPYAKYGKPRSKGKKLWARHESAQMDGQTDSYSFAGGIKKNIKFIASMLQNIFIICLLPFKG